MRKRRRTKAFAPTSKRIKRAGAIACPVVYECLKKIADSNVIWSLKSCAGSVATTVDKFSSSTAFNALQGPFTTGTGEAIDNCGYLGINVYQDPNAVPSAGAISTEMHPASTEYRHMPFDVNVFPMIAMTNPVVSAGIFNESNCRASNQCNVKFFDNKHSLRIIWPQFESVVTGTLWAVKKMTLSMHEVVYWVKDLSTIEDNALVNTAAQTATHELTQARLRISRSWLKQMYNAYFVNHPLDDSDIGVGGAGADEIDLTTTVAFDTFDEQQPAASRINDDNTLPRWRDASEFIANGVTDRRKDAKPIWNRRRTFRRPYPRLTGSVVHEDGTVNTGSQPEVHTHIRAGKRFHINEKMEWERIAADAVPDTTVREVVPRGCYVYCKYWYLKPNSPAVTALVKELAPSVSLAFTGAVDKTHVLAWQNM